MTTNKRIAPIARFASAAVATGLLLAGCSQSTPTPDIVANPNQNPPASQSATQSPPSAATPGANPAPTGAAVKPVAGGTAVAAPPNTANVAARVNGADITRARLDAEVLRYMAGDPASPKPESAEGKALAAQLRDLVLDSLIEQTVIEQEAGRLRIAVTDKDITDDINTMIDQQGGKAQFDEWLKSNNFTDKDIRELARQELMATAVRDRVTASQPKSAEYVHALHILVNTEAEAKQVLQQIQSGAKFETVAKSKSIDPSTAPDGGDLGWFTKGTGAVLWEEVEQSALQLKPNQISGVVKSPVGFHIIKVVARENRALTAEDAAYLQQTAFEQWLDQQKNSAKIERLP